MSADIDDWFPVMTADNTGTDVIYLTPFRGNILSLPTPAGYWKNFEIGADLTLTLTGLTANKNYDIFCYNSGGTPTLELSAAWTSDILRADIVAGVQGIQYKNANATRLLVGTFRATDTDETRFIINPAGGTKPQVLLSNYFNRIQFLPFYKESANNWVYGTDAWRQANANVNNQIEFVRCIGDMPVEAQLDVFGANGATVYARVGIGLNSTTVDSSIKNLGHYIHANWYERLTAKYQGIPSIGFNYLSWMERGDGSGATTAWHNAIASLGIQSGFIAKIFA